MRALDAIIFPNPSKFDVKCFGLCFGSILLFVVGVSISTLKDERRMSRTLVTDQDHPSALPIHRDGAIAGSGPTNKARDRLDEFSVIGVLPSPKTEMQFSTKCNMTIDIQSRVLSLKTEAGVLLVKEGGMFEENGVLIGDVPPRALICESADTGAQVGGAALFTVTSGASYTFKGWTGFINKYCWAKHHRVHLYLWLGEVDRSFLENKTEDALPCSNHEPVSNHYFRPLGMRAVLEEKKPSWILNLDLQDAWFPAQHFLSNHLPRFLREDVGDLVNGKVHGQSQVFMNGAVIAFKNTAWAKYFLLQWFKNRCGRKDQLSLWHSLFTEWKKEIPSLEWDVKKLLKYDTAMLYVPKVAERYLGWKNGFNSEELHLPHVTIMPNVARSPNVAFRWSEDGQNEPFICHIRLDKANEQERKKCDHRMDLCAESYMCSC
ncbi:unnamed protein product [Prorocentrum cordatum]|uniref:Nucleotide-diphospho-sugar transferase domain-containing protein n=1 Tax=Prorocentrum cordatum TaxID=2364126 RepID=A0ABN9REA8_9DINO|nr:unnamed protein product [Polarella glacialis]